MFKIDEYIRFVNVKNNNTFLFLSQFVEINTSKTMTVITQEYLDHINLGNYQTLLNFMKKYAKSICNSCLSEKYVNIKSFEALGVRAKL